MGRRASASWRSAVALVATLLVAELASAGSALAHGPCDCLEPRLTQAGRMVRIAAAMPDEPARGYPAYRVVFNPRPTDLGIAPAYLATALRADAPTETVLERPRNDPTRRARFRVPRDVPPGLYMVLIFDGGEGGAHNTWDYLHVVDWESTEPGGVVTERGAGEPPARPTSGPSSADVTDASDGGAPTWPLVVLAVAGGLALGLAGGRRLRSRNP